MAFEPFEQRTLRVRTATHRHRPFARQPFAARRTNRGRRFERRRGWWAGTLGCFCAAVILLTGMAAFPLLSSPLAIADVDTEKRASQDANALQESTSVAQRTASLEVPALQQNPELPTGCESLALTNALLSLGFDLEKTEIADRWLRQSENDFVTSFMGDPHSTEGHSCMAPAIAQTAAAYLAAQQSSLEAVDMTGASLEEMLREVADGNPVIAWCTIGLADPGTAYDAARVGDRTYRLYADSHCVVVSGYDLDAGVVRVSDSLAGQVSYDLQTFAARYYELGTQAVVIK